MYLYTYLCILFVRYFPLH